MAINSKTPPPKKKNKLGTPPKEESTIKFDNLSKPADNELVACNFYVPKEFKKDFKLYAFTKERAMVQVMMEAVNNYMKENP